MCPTCGASVTKVAGIDGAWPVVDVGPVSLRTHPVNSAIESLFFFFRKLHFERWLWSLDFELERRRLNLCGPDSTGGTWDVHRPLP